MDEVRDPLDAALSQLRAEGFVLDRVHLGPPPRGKVWRVPIEGGKSNSRPGWYVAYTIELDGGGTAIVGSYGVWSGAESTKHKLGLRGVKLSDADRDRLQVRRRELVQAQEADEIDQAREVSERAAGIWKALRSCSGSPYLTAKGVSAYGVAQGRDGTVVIALRNSAGMICQLQFISADGTKKFLTGPGKRGSFHLIGTVVDEQPLIFAEGYATGASIHEATGWPVVICIDAGNMLEVANRLRPVYPDAEFVFAADDDHDKKQNTGREIVTRGAQRYRGKVVFPRFKEPAGRTDFNDVHAEQGLDAVREQLEAILTPTRPSDAEIREPWLKQLVYGRNGLEPMVQNAMTVLLNHPAWIGVFGYDEFAKRIVKLKIPPYGGSIGPLRDTDEIEAAAWFGRIDTFATGFATGTVRAACCAVAERNPFHPVRNYVGALKWDGVVRLPTFFEDFCNVNPTTAEKAEIAAAFAINFFISAVARIYIPGCKADCMLVLEGEQGARKSTLAEVLAGPGFYADIGISPSEKDFFQSIQGCWIIELSELASFARAETAHIKRALSVHTDKYRKSYGHNVEEFKRESVFIGTVNNSDWQRDETGGRRYMPVWVEDINIDGVRAIRDQLWAEAKHRFDNGEVWHILPEAAKAVQDQRYVEDVWLEPIVDFLDGKSRSGSLVQSQTRKEECTVSQLLTYALEMDVKKQDRSAQTRVGNLLARMKWIRKDRRIGNGKVRVYCRPKDAA